MANVLDRTELFHRVAEDRDLLGELAEMYSGDLPCLLKGLRSAIEEGDSDLVRRRAHRLKGTFAALAAPGAVDAATELELSGENGDLDRARAALVRLEREATRVERELREIEGQAWG